MFSDIIQRYLSALQNVRSHELATAELSLRHELTKLFQDSATALKHDVQFIGEAKATQYGRPDYIVTQRDRRLGYIEAEKWDADLKNLSGHARQQNALFIANLDNFLLTNHRDFHLYEGGKLVAEASLPADGKSPVSDAALADFERLMDKFLGAEAQAPKTPGELAKLLSKRARQLKAAIAADLQFDDSPSKRSFEAFKRILRPEMEPDEFADLFAQTLAYGFFAARCVAPDGTSFDRFTVQRYLGNNPLLETLFAHFVRESDSALDWVIDDIAQMLKNAPMQGIREYFAQKSGRADPMIDFYEPFLHAYDPKQRELRGVYYTPEPVVGYIVRSLDALLKQVFKLEGLSDKKALILDPATGTGSFLFAVFEAVRHEIQSIAPHDWPRYARENLMPRLFGFELMVAPYTIAHLKLDMALDASGVELGRRDRAQIFLTNTLDDARRYSDVLLEQSIAAEVNAAADVKEKAPVLVVLGNPPYSGHSANKTRDAEGRLNRVGEIIESYRFIDGISLGEKNPKWLQDDYVKFLAFAQDRIRRSGEGVIGFITNHGYLDNPTFRGMRKSFLDSFTHLYVMDLHGNAKKKETAPDGSADKNVFDIQQGVAIILAVKEKGKTGPAQVFHADLWGRREDKYQTLDAEDVTTTQWQELKPAAPFYLFVPRDEANAEEYEKGWKVTEIFPVNSVGIVSARDHMAVTYLYEEIWETVQELVSLDIEVARTRFDLGPDARDWKVAFAQADLKSSGPSRERIMHLLYRPFDIRFTYYTGNSRGFICMPRREVTRHFFSKQNLGFCYTRPLSPSYEFSVICTSYSVDQCVIGNKSAGAGISYMAPLYLFSDEQQMSLGFEDTKRPNISDGFAKALAAALGVKLDPASGLPAGITPEAIFHYIYAVLHSPAYRERYAAFLKTDFPRVPLPQSPDEFSSRVHIGAQLVALHTLDTSAAPQLNQARHKLDGQGAGRVEKVTYEPSTRRVRINDTQSFTDVDENTFSMRIGGYQPAEKWLKDRKGRQLTIEDVRHYNRMLIALAETRRLMQEL